MQTGYQLNKAKEELAVELLRQVPSLENVDAIVEKIVAIVAAGVGIQSHPGSPLTNM